MLFRRLLRSAALPAVVCLCLGSLVAAESDARVLINEVLYDPDGPDTGLEFVELVNCGRVTVSLAGWVLETGNGAGPDDWTVEWIGDDLDHLDPGCLLVIGESEVVPAPDYVTALDLQNGPDGVRLSDGSEPVDVVGWGEPLFPEYFEGAPATDVASGHSLARVPDCFDQDDNSFDMTDCPLPTPGAMNTVERDLALRVRHAGNVVVSLGDQAEVECVVTNKGAVTMGGEARLDVFRSGAPEPSGSAVLGVDLCPRDSVEVVLLPALGGGYHRLRVELTVEDDDRTNNTAATTVTVGGVSGLVAVNEVMHSPADGGTEWVELVSTSGESVSLQGWALGDEVEWNSVLADSTAEPELSACDFIILAKDPAPLDGLASCPVFRTDGWEALSADDVIVLVDEFGTPIERVSYRRDWGGDRGVSMERVRPDLPAGERVNWGGSVAPEGSTPGRINSIHMGAAPVAGSLTVSPNPFTPDSDGKDDRALVRVELPVATAIARVTVFDLDGRVRAVLADQKEVSSTTEFVWNGAGIDGSILPSGLYIVYLEAINASQGVLVTAKTATGIVR